MTTDTPSPDGLAICHAAALGRDRRFWTLQKDSITWQSRRTAVVETKKSTAAPARTRPPARKLLEQYECGPVAFSGTPDASYERRLVFDHVVRPEQSDSRQRFEAVAWALRDLLSQRWLKTDETYDRANPKQVYYLSLEFLIGRSLANNILNLRVEPSSGRRWSARSSTGHSLSRRSPTPD